MMPPVGLMPPPPMTVDGGDFMAMQLPPGMPGLPSSARPSWPGTSMPMQGMGSGCSAPMVSSIPSDHSAQGPAFQHHSMAGGFPHVPSRGKPEADLTILLKHHIFTLSKLRANLLKSESLSVDFLHAGAEDVSC